MEEVIKTKKQKAKKVDPKLKKMKGSDADKKVKTPVEPEPEEVEEDEVEVKEKKSKKGWIIAILLIAVLVGGGFVAKKFLTKTTVATETVKLSSDARGVSNYFKEYLLDRAKAEELFKYDFKNLSRDDILTKLTELKDGFSKVSRGVSGNYATGEYKEIAEVMESDSSMYLTAVRELRSLMTADYGSDEERQAAFTQKVEETTKDLRSAIFVTESAFYGEVSGFSSKGALIFEGPVLVEVGGGVMNIIVGSFEQKLVAVSTEQVGGDVKLIEAKKLYGYASTKLIEIGESLNSEMESGWVKHVKADVSRTEVKLTRTRISTILKNARSMDEELKAQGINGLVGDEKKSAEDELKEVVKGITGKK